MTFIGMVIIFIGMIIGISGNDEVMYNVCMVGCAIGIVGMIVDLIIGSILFG